MDRGVRTKQGKRRIQKESNRAGYKVSGQTPGGPIRSLAARPTGDWGKAAMKPHRLMLGLVLTSLICAILMPPEAYPSGKMVVIVCATFAFLAAITEKRIPNSYLVGGLVLF